MKDKIVLFAKHPLILGSSVIFIGSMAASLLNYFFNLIMGRFLSVNDYGTLASLVSVFSIFSVFSIAIMMVFSKFAASLAGQKKEKAIGSLFIAGSIWVSIIAFIICIILIIISPQIASFLKINSVTLVIVTVFALFFSFLSGVSSGILQGLLKFNSFSLINILSSVVKLILGIVFVFLGYKVFGAIMAFFLSSLFGYVFAFLPLYKFIKLKIDDGFTLSSLHQKAYSYALPVFFSNIGITALISVDIILIKHYFNPTVAGQYAALSLMGRSIFYVVSPISSVLFPLIAQKKERKEKLTGTLLLSILLIAIPSIILSFIYFFIPEVVLRIFFPGSAYASLAPHLGPFSIFILLYCLAFLMNSFYLSIGKAKVFILTMVGAIAEILFIVVWHKDINQIIMDLIASSFLLALILLVYYRNATKNS